MPSGSPMPARGRLRRVAGHVVGASAAAARPGQPRLINVGPEEQSPAARSPWAGWGIGSYEDPDDGTDYSWRDELIEPGVHHQLFIDDGALAAAVGITRTLQPPRKVGGVLSSPLAGFDCQSRNSPQWNPETGLWEWWVMAQRLGRLAAHVGGAALAHDEAVEQAAQLAAHPAWLELDTDALRRVHSAALPCMPSAAVELSTAPSPDRYAWCAATWRRCGRSPRASCSCAW